MIPSLPQTGARPGPRRAAIALVALGAALWIWGGATPLGLSRSATPIASATPVTAATSIGSVSSPVEASSVGDAAPAPVLPAAVPDGYRIRIARLGIDLPIAEGDLKRDMADQHTPEGYAFHLPGTSLPGRAGNTYLYAHARTGMFLSLWGARAGDLVEVVEPDGSALVYVVREVRARVAPDDLSVAGPTADERLTLQTSTGPNAQDARFVVIAYPRGA